VEYRRLGGSGLKVSVVGLGGNTFGRYADADQTARIIHHAIDVGVNFVDTADSYPNTPGFGISEEYIGRALRGRRSDMMIATKVCSPVGPGPNDVGISRKHVMDSIDASLRRLGTDYVDLYQLHHWDAQTPLEESLRALDDLVRAGKVRYVGCSNFTGWQTVWALWVANQQGYVPLVSNQPQYSLLERDAERELIPACLTHGVGLVPYSPLAGGMLTGKYKEGEAPPADSRGADNARVQQRFDARGFRIVRRLSEWAEARGHTAAELAIAWLVAQPVLSTIIAGARRPEQVEANALASEWKLTADDLREIDELTEWSRTPGFLTPYIHPTAPRS
jgi:aryl-alcohol dehydrogenase-like predicted oxidoreductase